jgi:hypothetical protein
MCRPVLHWIYPACERRQAGAGFQTRMERDQEDYKFRERLASGGGTITWNSPLQPTSIRIFIQVTSPLLMLSKELIIS